MPLNSEKLPVDTTIAMNAAAVAVSRKSEIAMPLYSPVPTQYTSSSFAPALSITFLIAASRPDAFFFQKALGALCAVLKQRQISRHFSLPSLQP
jgi:hypothetical protein